LLMMPPQVLDERRAPRSLLFQPFHFVGAVVRVGVYPLGVAIERIEIARQRIGEAPHHDPADAVRSFWIVVLPRDVVPRAGREHLDVVLRREPLSKQPAQMLRSAQNLGAVALDDEGDSHESCRTSSVRSRLVRASPKAASRRRWPAITPALRSSSKARAPRSSAASSRSFGAN